MVLARGGGRSHASAEAQYYRSNTFLMSQLLLDIACFLVEIRRKHRYCPIEIKIC